MMNILMILLISLYLDKIILDLFIKEDIVLDKKNKIAKIFIITISLLFSLFFINFLFNTISNEYIFFKYFVFIIINYILVLILCKILKLEEDIFIVNSMSNILLLSIIFINETSYGMIFYNVALIFILYVLFDLIINHIMMNLVKDKMINSFKNYPILLIILGIIAILCERYIF